MELYCWHDPFQGKGHAKRNVFYLTLLLIKIERKRDNRILSAVKFRPGPRILRARRNLRFCGFLLLWNFLTRLCLKLVYITSQRDSKGFEPFGWGSKGA
jgi:hypothetical protein